MSTDEQRANDPNTPPAQLDALARRAPSLALRVAQNTAAPAALLVWLMNHQEENIRRAVAQNPNAPRKALLHLALQFPAEVLDNPGFLLLTLEDPSFFSSLSPQLLVRLLSQPAPPPALLALAIRSPHELARTTAAQHPALQAAQRFALCGDASASVRRAIAQNPVARAEVELFQRAGAAPSLAELSATTPHNTTMDELSALATGGLFAQLLVASHPNATPELLRQVEVSSRQSAPSSHHYHVAPFAVHQALLKHPRTPPDVVERFCLEPYPALRAGAAAHPNTPRAFLALLVRAGSTPNLEALQAPDETIPAAALDALAERGPWGKKLAAAHPNTPRARLAVFLQQPSEFRDSLARNPTLSGPELQSLYYAASTPTKLSLALNPSAPPKLLASLLEEPDPALRRAAAVHPSTPAQALAARALHLKEEAAIRTLLSQHPQFPRQLAEVLSALAPENAAQQTPAQLSRALAYALQQPGTYLHLLAARHPALPVAEQEQLSRSSQYKVRAALAGSAALLPEVAARLVKDSDLWVREALAENPKAPPSCVLALSSDAEEVVRWAAARNPSTPAEALRRLAQSNTLRIREAALRSLRAQGAL